MTVDAVRRNTQNTRRLLAQNVCQSSCPALLYPLLDRFVCFSSGGLLFAEPRDYVEFARQILLLAGVSLHLAAGGLGNCSDPNEHNLMHSNFVLFGNRASNLLCNGISVKICGS